MLACTSCGHDLEFASISGMCDSCEEKDTEVDLDRTAKHGRHVITEEEETSNE
jgi:endogenous inhibitor of DNA gyrase (YacG/DUF329 family)